MLTHVEGNGATFTELEPVENTFFTHVVETSVSWFLLFFKL